MTRFLLIGGINRQDGAAAYAVNRGVVSGSRSRADMTRCPTASRKISRRVRLFIAPDPVGTLRPHPNGTRFVFVF